METQIFQILNAITLDMWFVFFQFVFAFLIFLLIKDTISTLTNYLVFRTSKFISKNVRVNINGVDGFIEDYNLRAIFIRTDEGDLKIVPMNRWRFQDWTIKYGHIRDKKKQLRENGK